MFTTLLRNATIVDGTGAEPYKGDIALEQGKIAAMGDLSHVTAHQTIDVAGRCVTPGFMDMHRHGDVALFDPDFDPIHLAQGLTTLIHGNCGLSVVPLSNEPARFADVVKYLTPITGAIPPHWAGFTMADYQKEVAQAPTKLHHAMLVGGGTLRAMVAGFDPSPFTQAQLHTYHTQMEQALAQGAVGVSIGLGYAPECFYTTEQLCQALAPLEHSGRVVSIHMRQEGLGVVEALDEAITLGRRLKTPIQISHLKAIGNRGNTMEQLLERIHRARGEGIDIACDVYPYTAGSTQLLHTLPPEVKAGGVQGALELLQNPAMEQTLRHRLATGQDFENIVALAGFDNIIVTGHPPVEGQSVAQIAKTMGCDGYTALFQTLIASQGRATMIDFIVREEDVMLALQQPFTSVISDATYPATPQCHPRVYGAYTRLLETYVQTKKVLTLPQAIHKITAMPANRYGLSSKGTLAVGMDADLCVFYPENLHERATFAQPRTLSQGMDWVFIGGEIVYQATI